MFVMGILNEYHNRGIGKKLMNEGEKILSERNYKYLMVKTLGESHPDINYKKQELFIQKLDFTP